MLSTLKNKTKIKTTKEEKSTRRLCKHLSAGLLNARHPSIRILEKSIWRRTTVNECSILDSATAASALQLTKPVPNVLLVYLTGIFRQLTGRICSLFFSFRNSLLFVSGMPPLWESFQELGTTAIHCHYRAVTQMLWHVKFIPARTACPRATQHTSI